MKIHEYQGKEILKKYGVPVPRAIPAFSVAEAVQAAQALGGSVWVVKAQIHAGGRGKGGGVKVAKSMEELTQFATDILGMQLVTHQTGPVGQKVRRLLIEEGADIKKEYYLGMVVDRGTQKICIMASSEGGMDIEEVAEKTPELIHKLFISPSEGLSAAQCDDLMRKIGVPEASIEGARVALQGLYKAFWETDAALAEINPLVLTGNGSIVALDAKMDFDANALYRHPELVEMRDLDEEDPAEIEASKFDLAYISLDGNIGCLVNGAGLAMATMDTIKLYGGEPANFLDVGGGATAEKVTEAFKIMLKNPELKAILVNIFGGIMRCDVIAEGVITAAKQVQLQVPLVVRMKGTNDVLGKKMLAESGLPIISADTMAEAAEQVVAATRGTGISGMVAGVGAAAAGAVAAVAAGADSVIDRAEKALDGTIVETAYDAVIDGAEKLVDGIGGVVGSAAGAITGLGDSAAAAYDGVVDGAEKVIGGVGGAVVDAVGVVGDVAGSVVDTASETLGNIGDGVAAVGAGAVAAGATALGLAGKGADKAAGGVAGVLKRFWWLPLLAAAGYFLVDHFKAKDAVQPAPTAVTAPVASEQPAPKVESKTSFGTWALGLVSAGRYELSGKVADAATKDAMLAAAKKAFGDANVADKLTVDASASAIGFKGDWNQLFDLFKGKGVTLSADGNNMMVMGEVADAAAKTAMMEQVKALLPDAALTDHLMVKGATASEGAKLLHVAFATGSAVVPAASHTELNALAADLKAQKTKGEVSGHTDNQGDATQNAALSEARAKAVVDYLVKQGVAADALTAKGYGNTKPIASDAAAEGRARNRRVEFSAAN